MKGNKFKVAVLVASALALIATAGYWTELLKALLRWIDFLAPKPGLSGLFLLGLLPFGFVALCVIVEWAMKRSASAASNERSPS